MAALDLDVFRRSALLLATALPCNDAVAPGIDCRARYRRWKLHSFAAGPVIDSAFAEDFVEPPGITRLWLIGEWAAERDHLTYQVWRSPHRLARKDAAEAPSDQADLTAISLSKLGEP